MIRSVPLVLSNEEVAAAVVTIVVTPPVSDNSIFTVNSILAMDKTSAIATLIEIGIRDGMRDIPIDSTPGSFPAATSHTIYWPCVLSAGQRIYAKFATPTADDKLLVSAFGVVEYLDVGGVDRR